MRLLRIALPIILIAIFLWWMTWSPTLGTTYMGRELTAGESLRACFLNQWPETPKP